MSIEFQGSIAAAIAPQAVDGPEPARRATTAADDADAEAAVTALYQEHEGPGAPVPWL